MPSSDRQSKDRNSRASLSTRHGPNGRTRRTWADNDGGRHVFETSSFSTPAFSYVSIETSFTANRPQSTSPLPRASSLFGIAFDLLGGLWSTRQALREDIQHREHLRRQRIAITTDEKDSFLDVNFDDGRAKIPPESWPFPFSAPDHFSFESPRQRSAPVPSSTFTLKRNQKNHSLTDHSTRRGHSFSDENLNAEINVIEALQKAARHHRRSARRLRKHLAEASTQPNVDVNHLQTLVNQLQRHETAHHIAVQDLAAAQDDLSGSIFGHEEPSGDRMDIPFNDRTFTEHFPFPEFASTFQSPHAHFHHGAGLRRTFRNLNNVNPGVFPGLDKSWVDNDFPHFFGTPHAHFSFNTGQRSNSHSQADNQQPESRGFPDSRATSFPPQSIRRSTNLLRSEEARTLYKMYNETWERLSPTDSDIPFPARGLLADSLVSRDSIWTPNSDISTWSEDVVMKANTQAFFLAAAGLVPQYAETPGTGVIRMGFDKSFATPEQVDNLRGMLKKERTRWHSDRLGRRNQGKEGVNVALQYNEKARAVFHSVCELIDAAH